MRRSSSDVSKSHNKLDLMLLKYSPYSQRCAILVLETICTIITGGTYQHGPIGSGLHTDSFQYFSTEEGCTKSVTS